MLWHTLEHERLVTHHHSYHLFQDPGLDLYYIIFCIIFLFLIILQYSWVHQIIKVNVISLNWFSCAHQVSHPEKTHTIVTNLEAEPFQSPAC